MIIKDRFKFYCAIAFIFLASQSLLIGNACAANQAAIDLMNTRAFAHTRINE